MYEIKFLNKKKRPKKRRRIGTKRKKVKIVCIFWNNIYIKKRKARKLRKMKEKEPLLVLHEIIWKTTKRKKEELRIRTERIGRISCYSLCEVILKKKERRKEKRREEENKKKRKKGRNGILSDLENFLFLVSSPLIILKIIFSKRLINLQRGRKRFNYVRYL